MINLIYEENDKSTRLDNFVTIKLSEIFKDDGKVFWTRSQVKRLIDDGKILVNSKKIKAGYLLQIKDKITIEEIEPQEINAKAQEIPLNIIYEDEDIIVINKVQGMVVHPCATTKDGTLVNALLFHTSDLSGINGKLRPGIVHRLDKDTSGLIVVAKNDKAHKVLSKQLETKTCKRIYLAILEGNLKEDSGVVHNNLGRDVKNRKKYAVVNEKSGKEAITHYKVLKRYKNNCLVEFELKTGRTHQIRVHSAYLGHPIVGDKLYGYAKQKFKTNGQLLHAKELIFIHPLKNVEMKFDCVLPDYFKEILNKL